MKQEQNNEITLGIDIGTQFCSAGYVLNNEYHQIDFGVEVYEVPTVVCLYGNENSNELIMGSAAVDCINARYGINGAVYILDAKESIKTLMRDGADDAEFLNEKNECIKKEVKELVVEFIGYLADKIKDKIKKFKIAKINVAYSERTDNAGEKQNENYKKTVCEAVADKFELNKKIIKMVPEYDLSARLFKDICKTYNGESFVIHSKICAIDVGAGTTDIACLRWDGRNYVIATDEKKTLQTSCRFGGKCVDDILTNSNCWSGAGILHKYVDPEVFISTKKWLVDGTQGDEIKWGNKQYYEIVKHIEEKCDMLEESRTITKFKDKLNKLLNMFCKGTDRKSVQFILIGGSSVLPFVSNAIRDVAGNTNNIFYLNDIVANTPMHYINNSNFISRAAAGYECDVYTTNYALRYTEIDKKNKYKDGYKIISSKGIFNEECYYYDNKADTMVDKNNNVCGFDLNGAVFEIKMPEIVAMEFALRGEDFCFIPGEPETVIKAARKLDESEFKCPPKQPMRNKNVNVGCVINGSNVGGEKLKIVVFDQEEQGCGPDKEEVGKKVFLQKALDTARVHGNKFPVELIEKYKLDKAKE